VKTKTLFAAFGDIDDRYISEASDETPYGVQPRRAARPVMFLAPIAACLLIAAILALPQIIGSPGGTPGGDGPAPGADGGDATPNPSRRPPEPTPAPGETPAPLETPAPTPDSTTPAPTETIAPTPDDIHETPTPLETTAPTPDDIHETPTPLETPAPTETLAPTETFAPAPLETPAPTPDSTPPAIPDRGQPPSNLRTIMFDPSEGITAESAAELRAFASANSANGGKLSVSAPIIGEETKRLILDALSGIFTDTELVYIELDWALPEGQVYIPVTLRYIDG
jgi:hypothetical protein